MNVKLRIFFKYLSDNDCLESFIHYSNKRCVRYGERFDTFEIAEDYILRNLLSGAFTWSDTLEGYAFWNELSAKIPIQCYA